MGSEIPLASYVPQNADRTELIQNISKVLDSLSNPVFVRYGLVNSGGLNIDARDLNPANFPIGVDAFSANANVGFQKTIEEAELLNIGGLISYVCVSGMDPESFYSIICCPAGKLFFSDPNTESEIIQPISFIALFPLTYGAIPVLCEARNIVYSILNIIGTDPMAEKFINSINAIAKSRFQ